MRSCYLDHDDALTVSQSWRCHCGCPHGHWWHFVHLHVSGGFGGCCSCVPVAAACCLVLRCLKASPAWGAAPGLNSQDRAQPWCRAVARTAKDGAGGGGRQCDLQQPVDSRHFYVLLCGACPVNGCPRCMCVIDLSVAVAAERAERTDRLSGWAPTLTPSEKKELCRIL
jgi:hypothetical protein